MFIVIEEKTEDVHTDESLQRLPVFGRAYDIEDDSLIDKIKKEMKINE